MRLRSIAAPSLVCLLLAAALTAPLTARAQVGPLLWEDNFTSLNNWLKITGNINWGWGNGELEYYHNDNVDIACLLYTSPSPRDRTRSRMPSSA